jgi:hypothetical protein
MLTKIALTHIFNAHVNAIPMLTTKASLPFDGLEMDSALEGLKNRIAYTEPQKLDHRLRWIKL